MAYEVRGLNLDTGRAWTVGLYSTIEKARATLYMLRNWRRSHRVANRYPPIVHAIVRFPRRNRPAATQ